MYLKFLIFTLTTLVTGQAFAEPVWRGDYNAYGSRASGTYLAEYDAAFSCNNGQAVIGTSMSEPGNIYVAVKDQGIIQHLRSGLPASYLVDRKDDLQNSYSYIGINTRSIWRMERRTDNFHLIYISPDAGVRLDAKKEGDGLYVEAKNLREGKNANWYFDDCRYIFNEQQPYPETVYPGAKMYDKYEVIARCDAQIGPGRIEAQRRNEHQAGEIVIGVDPQERRNIALVFKPYVAERGSFASTFIQRFVGWPKLPTINGFSGTGLSHPTWSVTLRSNEGVFAANQHFQAKGSQVRKVFPTNNDEQLVVEFFRTDRPRLQLTNLQGGNIANWQFGACDIVE